MAGEPSAPGSPAEGRTTPGAAAVGPPPGMAVRLSSNESPFGPSPAAVRAIRGRADSAHIYPDDQSVHLRAAVAEHESVPVEKVAAGHGSSGLLMDLIASETRRRESPGELLTYQHAFIVYRLGAQVAGARLVEAPVGDGYARDPASLLDRVSEHTRIVCVDNPANPTGAHLTGDQLRRLVRALPDHVTVVVDEAYHHFAAGQRGYATVTQTGVTHPRLCVLRTFSKAYALAGLRIGYLLGPPQLVATVDAARVRFNVNAIGQAAAVAALGDDDHLERTVAGTCEGRARMTTGLAELGVPVVEGLGNFVLVELDEPADRVVEAYAQRGVGVRPLAPYNLTEQIRVTVGTPAEIDRFLEVSREVLAGVASRTRPGSPDRPATHRQ